MFVELAELQECLAKPLPSQLSRLVRVSHLLCCEPRWPSLQTFFAGVSIGNEEANEPESTVLLGFNFRKWWQE